MSRYAEQHLKKEELILLARGYPATQSTKAIMTPTGKRWLLCRSIPITGI
jgi:hypothetical protein